MIHGILGEKTEYPTEYDPNILYAIPRELGRKQLKHINFFGFDWWHCFEISWLNNNNIPQVGLIRLEIPANSEFITESKSLKLYFNSINFRIFNNEKHLINTIENDISKCINSQIKAYLFNIEDTSFFINKIDGINIDNALNDSIDQIIIPENIDINLLNKEDLNKEYIEQEYYSHLLRSNCPVTNQPDWGSIYIKITSNKINSKNLLRYILGYRKHNGFHEQCVEQIFNDLTEVFKPTSLLVRAWYTRRGGIDINPCRASHKNLIPKASRLNRQ